MNVLRALACAMAAIVHCWFVRRRVIRLSTQSITDEILFDINTRYGYVVADDVAMLSDTAGTLQRQWRKMSSTQTKRIIDAYDVRMVRGPHREDCEAGCSTIHWIEHDPFDDLSPAEKLKHGCLACNGCDQRIGSSIFAKDRASVAWLKAWCLAHPPENFAAEGDGELCIRRKQPNGTFVVNPIVKPGAQLATQQTRSDHCLKLVSALKASYQALPSFDICHRSTFGSDDGSDHTSSEDESTHENDSDDCTGEKGSAPEQDEQAQYRRSPRLSRLCRREEWTSDSQNSDSDSEAGDDATDKSATGISKPANEPAGEGPSNLMPRSIDAMDDEQLLNRYWMYRQKVQRMDEELHAIRHDFRLVSLKRPARQEAYLSYKQYKDALLDPNRAGGVLDPKDQNSDLCRATFKRWCVDTKQTAFP